MAGLCMAGALVALTGCSGAGGGRIEAGTLSAGLDAGDAPVVLDVRTASEFEAGHVPGAGHFPFESTWTRRGALPPALDTPIVVYCEHGPRAALARFGLESLGYRDVRMLSGHMAHWRKAGLAVEQGAD